MYSHTASSPLFIIIFLFTTNAERMLSLLSTVDQGKPLPNAGQINQWENATAPQGKLLNIVALDVGVVAPRDTIANGRLRFVR